MLQVRMNVTGFDNRGSTKTVILEPARDKGNAGIPEECQIAEGVHISGRLSLTYDTPKARECFETNGEFVLTLTVAPVLPEPVKEDLTKPSSTRETMEIEAPKESVDWGALGFTESEPK